MQFMLADANLTCTLVFGGLGFLMIAFPRAFIAFRDLGAALKGYAPVEGSFMRSPILIRTIGAIAILFAWIIWHL